MRPSKEQIEAILALRSDGLSKRAIVKRTGIPTHHVSYVVECAELPKPPARRVTHTVEWLVPEDQRP